MAPRGVKTLLKKSAPCKLSTGKYKCFRSKSGRKLKGLTKTLERRVWSKGVLPLICKRSDGRGGYWNGKNGGQKRGSMVDAQLTRCVNRNQKPSFKLTKLALAALKMKKIEPVMAQRAVASGSVGTAIDVIGYSREKNSLIVVELKCGYDHGRKASVTHKGRVCKLQPPFDGAVDCVLNRHLAQLAITRELFVREADVVTKLKALGISQIEGLLLYVNNTGIEFFEPNAWWERHARKSLIISD